jgi:hypothetical protein
LAAVAGSGTEIRTPIDVAALPILVIEADEKKLVRAGMNYKFPVDGSF